MEIDEIEGSRTALLKQDSRGHTHYTRARAHVKHVGKC